MKNDSSVSTDKITEFSLLLWAQLIESTTCFMLKCILFLYFFMENSNLLNREKTSLCGSAGFFEKHFLGSKNDVQK